MLWHRTGMAAIEHVYRYADGSRLEGGAAGPCLALVAESRASEAAPVFFDGRLLEPAISAACLHTVSDLVGSRFYIPPAMLARILREADPVVTVGRAMLRFEGFSACCSSYIRHDIEPAAFAAEAVCAGSTNVDFRDRMRGALAQVRSGADLRLTVSAEAVGLSHERAEAVERKVPLPIRWLKGFAEVQVHQAGMRPALTLSKVAAQRFLRSLPRGPSDQPQWMVGSAAAPRLSARPAKGAVRLSGTRRLRLLEHLAAKAHRLDIHFNDALGSSAWVLDFGAQRLTLVLNAEPWRGFSGDGQLLSDLAREEDATTTAVRAQLAWQSALDREALAARTGHDAAAVDRALARLAAAGLVGFDIATGAYFHRVLPFDLGQIERLNPRLQSAERLVAAGAVALSPTPEGFTAIVESGGVAHRVTRIGETTTCTCPWFSKTRGARGPCKHVLAVEICAERTE